MDERTEARRWGTGTRAAGLLRAAWWTTLLPTSFLAYAAAVGTSGAAAPVGGAVFLAGLAMVATVARNGSAEAVVAGSVRPGSLPRAAAFGVLLHGGLLAAAFVGGGMSTLLAGWVLLGGAFVVLSRPATQAALGVAVSGDPHPHRMTTPEIVAALRLSAHEVRTTADPDRRAVLAAQRGELLEEVARRDPQLLHTLLAEGLPSVPAETPDDRPPA